MVMRGEVRIPNVDRRQSWNVWDVLELFDSLYQGYPIGALLFQRGPAQAGPLRLGSLEIFGIETSSALWVVDGQQRLTAMVAGLVRSSAPVAPASDLHEVYFDAATQLFHAPADGLSVRRTTWVPVSRLLSEGELREWLLAWEHGGDVALRSAVFEAGRRLREYPVPVYIVESDDAGVVRTVLARMNRTTSSVAWEAAGRRVLIDLLPDPPTSLAALGAQLEALGMGPLDQVHQLLPALVAVHGSDASSSDAVTKATPALRSALSFLRTKAEIPNLLLLPRNAPLVVLTRFFAEHPQPRPRTQILLVRWSWRCFLAESSEEAELQRRGAAAIDDDEEASVQRMLALVPDRERRFSSGLFNLFEVGSRLSMLAMVSARPLALQGGREIFVNTSELIREERAMAFRHLFKGVRYEGAGLDANYIVLPGAGPAEDELRTFLLEHGLDHPVLRSHGISVECAEALLQGKGEQAIEHRRVTLDAMVESLGHRLAGWGRTDRPSIEYLLAQVGSE